MNNLWEFLFLCYDNSNDYWEIGECRNGTTFLAWCNKRAIVKIGFYECVTIEILSVISESKIRLCNHFL